MDRTNDQSNGAEVSALQPLPSVAEIRRLLESDPRRVLSFANRFFSDNHVPVEFRIDAGIRLNSVLERSDKPHLWEGICGMVRESAGANWEPLFQQAKNSLAKLEIESSEAGSIRDFLSDIRIFSEKVSQIHALKSASEYERFLLLNVCARNCDRASLAELFSYLECSSTCDSYLIRESVAEALGVLGTRSDFDDMDLVPYQAQIESLISRLLCDIEPYVRQAALTVEPLVDLSSS